MNEAILLEALRLVVNELSDIHRDAQNDRCVIQQLGDLREYVQLELKRARRSNGGSLDCPGQLLFPRRRSKR